MKVLQCRQCGSEQTAEDAIYCSRCGSRLRPTPAYGSEGGGRDIGVPDSALRETAAGLERIGERERAGSSGRRSVMLAMLVPLLLLIAVGAGLYSYYQYEMNVNAEALSLHREAADEALAGRYGQAIALLRNALAVRPGYEAARTDLEIAEKAAELEAALNSVAARMQKQELTAAEQALINVEEGLKLRTEPVFDPIRQQLKDRQVMLTVMKVKAELDELDTMEELTEKLNLTLNLNGKEAEELRHQIESKIVAVTIKNAEELLHKKAFRDAAQAVEEGQRHVADSPKLTELKQRIEEEKRLYEETERQRIEEAMQKAAEEDLKNETAAVEVVSFQAKLDPYGDVQVHGELKNTATRAIYSVFVEYSLCDDEGRIVGSGKVGTTPEYIEPGETMTFEDKAFGVYAEVTVKIDRITWYLD